MPRDPLDIARSLARRFVEWQAPSGRPDPQRCPFVTRKGQFYPPNTHPPAAMARGLYLLYGVTQEPELKLAADRYAVFGFSYQRDPVPGYACRQRALWLRGHADRALYNSSASFQYGSGLDPAWRDFRTFNPDEDCFDARADSLFDWLQTRRTERGQAYELGYPPPDPAIPDWAFTDDLRHVGQGLVGYYELTRREEVLDAAVRLADYYLRPVQVGTAEGAFIEEIGTWCISPWPKPLTVEHLTNFRLDQAGWGWTARGAAEFLTRLHALLPDGHPRAASMRDRCVRSVRWQFGCQFPNGAVGMYSLDDEWLGMTSAALLAYADLHAAGWLSTEDQAELAPAARRAWAWLREAATEEFLDAGGYRKITGHTSPSPPENLVWLMAWTLEAVVRVQAQPELFG
jgi:hypothetical protein